jgi:Uma2 family endonuclease
MLDCYSPSPTEAQRYRQVPVFQTRLPPAFSPLPTPDDLPSDDNLPMETEPHRIQMELLIQPLKPWLAKHGGGYVSGNMFLYFSKTRSRRQDVRGPDVFVVLGVSRQLRDSWVVWEEGKGPEVVIELISEETAEYDKGERKEIYQDHLKVAEYFWFDPQNPDDWAGFELVGGQYREIATAGQTHLLSKQLGLTLVRWRGVHEGLDRVWLRWATLDGELLPTAEELAKAAEQRAVAETLARQQAEQRAACAELELARLKALLAQKS